MPTLRMSEEEYAAHVARQFPGVKAWAEEPKRESELSPTKRSKYGATAAYVDRIRFASKAEAARYAELRLHEHAGYIRDLVVHPAFPLTVDGEDIGIYRADFRYLRAGVEIIEDVKSPATAAKETFRRTQKHVLAQYGIEISIVLRGRKA